MKKTYPLWILAFVLIVIIVLVLRINKKPVIVTSVFNFDECVWAGYPVMESYPAQCSSPDGKNFTQDIGNELEKTDLIVIDNPRPNQQVTSPLVITGKARGNWYFEASFPVKILDANGLELGIVPATAMGEWMTNDFVPFSATLVFATPTTKTGTLVLMKDNPSGLTQYDDSLLVPIVFNL